MIERASEISILMGSTISKTVNIIDLPVDTDISSEDYIIIQNDTRTFRVQIQDMILTKDNVTFGQEINDIYTRVGQLQTVIAALQTQITDLDAKLAAEKLESANRLSTANSTIESLQSEITTLNGKFAELKSTVTANTTKADLALQRIDDRGADINKIRQDVSTNTDDILAIMRTGTSSIR